LAENWSWAQDVNVEPCADAILSAAARRLIWVGGGSAPTAFNRWRCGRKTAAAAAFSNKLLETCHY